MRQVGGCLIYLLKRCLAACAQHTICSTFFYIELPAAGGIYPFLKDVSLTCTFGAAGWRYFVEGGSVNPPYQCYVTTPSDAELAEAMSSGLYCMLVGHHQAGKSSTVLGAANVLKQAGSSLDVYHISLFGTLTSASQLWQLLGQRLHLLNSSRFPLPQFLSSFKGANLDADYSLSWFMPQAGRSGVALVIDEAAIVENLEELTDVLSDFTVCRDQRMNGWLLHSLVLLGTERIVSMVAKANDSGGRLLTPYTVVRIHLCLQLEFV